MFWQTFALIRNYARCGGRYAGDSSAAAGFLPCFESFLLAFSHGTGSLDDFSHARCWAVNPEVILGKGDGSSLAMRPKSLWTESNPWVSGSNWVPTECEDF